LDSGFSTIILGYDRFSQTERFGPAPFESFRGRSVGIFRGNIRIPLTGYSVVLRPLRSPFDKRMLRGIFALFCIGVVALWKHLSAEKEPAPAESAISLINGEGDTVSCPRKIPDDCMRDAESKGFVKLSEAVAGISVDWNAGPLSVVEVRGAAAEAGIRNGDILLELDGRKISEPRSISIIMSTKHPGDELKVKVMRTGSPMDFAYKVMPRSTQLSPVVTQ